MQQQLPAMRILESAFNHIVDHIASKPAESGGALYGRESDHVITRFEPDTNAHTTRSTYTIDTGHINALSRKLWEEEGLSLIGIVHSHPHGSASLSMPDRTYFAKLLTWVKRERFYAPIVFTVPDGGFKLIPHVLGPTGEVLGRTTTELVPDDAPVESAPAEAPKVAPAPAAPAGADLAEGTRYIEVMRQVVGWAWQALKVLLILLLGWVAVAITPALITFITNTLLNQ